MTILDVRPELSGVDADDEIDHLYCCCTPAVALCGHYLGEPEEASGDPDRCCEACDDLIEIVCILCGYGLYGPCACGQCP